MLKITEMLRYIIYFLSSSFISASLIPLIIKLSNKYGFVDIPNNRKIHKKPISRLGGLAIFISFLIVFSIILIKYYNQLNITFNIKIYIIALFLSFIIGFLDDIKNIRARYKLIVQIIISFLVSLSGLSIARFTFFNFFAINFGLFSHFITIVWIVLIMNSINLIDGMDGLASGIVAIATIFLLIVSILMKNILVSLISSVLLGSIIGFYIYNFPPAKIFMGDSGAYFLGFMYATLGLMGIKKTTIAVLFLVPLVLLFIPIIDVFAVSFKRLKDRKNIFTPDKNHLHHRLLALGFSNKKVLIILYLSTIILGFFSLLIVFIPNKFSFTLFILLFLVVFFLFYLIHQFEKLIKNTINNKN